jgi:hypothetical protein
MSVLSDSHRVSRASRGAYGSTQTIPRFGENPRMVSKDKSSVGSVAVTGSSEQLEALQ